MNTRPHNTLRKIVILLIIGILCVQNVACGMSDDNEITFSDLKSEDMEIIEYVNQNSNCGCKLLDVMEVKEKSAEAPYTELFGDYGEVKSYGNYIKEEDSVIRTSINIIKSSEYDILGIRYGDKYKDARESLEKAGFVWIEEKPFGSNYTVSYFKKGIVVVDFENKNTKTGINDDSEVVRICVSVPIEE